MKLLQQHNKKWWSVRSITSIVVSRLLIMLRSSLTEIFFSYITGFFMSNLGAGIVKKRRAEAAGSGCVMRHLLIFIEHILLQSPLDTLWSLTGYGTGMVIVFCQRPRDEAKFWGGIFHSKSEESRKEKKFKPIHQAALLSPPCPSASRWMVRIFTVKTHWPSSSSAPPFCPTDPKFCVLLLKFMNSCFSPLSPEAKPLRCCWVRGQSEGKALGDFCYENQVWLKSSSVSDMLSR